MARSNKPLVWSMFAAGGTLAALVIPALLLVTLMVGYEHPPSSLSYDNMHDFASGWPGKISLFAVISLCLWHAAHRMRTALHGLGLRADRMVAIAGYSIATAGTLLTLWNLFQI